MLKTAAVLIIATIMLAFGTYVIKRRGQRKELLSCYFGSIPQGTDPEKKLGRKRACNFKDFHKYRYDGSTCVYSKCVDFCYKIYVEGAESKNAPLSKRVA